MFNAALPPGGSIITISAFKWVPPFAQGLVRELRVRWALEEAGLAYKEKLIDQDDQQSDAYRALQPFGQVPTLRTANWCCLSQVALSCTLPNGATR